jgi:ubiquinone/menaquinone biosynthesis C-methylase UbiE
VTVTTTHFAKSSLNRDVECKHIRAIRIKSTLASKFGLTSDILKCWVFFPLSSGVLLPHHVSTKSARYHRTQHDATRFFGLQSPGPVSLHNSDLPSSRQASTSFTTMSSSTSTYKQGYHAAITANHVSRTAEKDAAFLLPYLKSGLRVLDVGCGPGSITVGFAKYVPGGSVTGIDLSDEVLVQAREFLQSQTEKEDIKADVNFEVGDVVKGLRFEDGEFDIVFCNQTLVHIPTPIPALKEMRRVCKKGGVVACREADWPFRFYPELPGLLLFHKYLWIMVHGQPPAPPAGEAEKEGHSWNSARPDVHPHPPNHRTGSRVHVWAREAGFDPTKITKGASAEVHATPEQREKLGRIMVGRIDEGGHREKYLKLGASEEEVDSIVRDWKKWVEDVDSWWGMFNCEVVCEVQGV